MSLGERIQKDLIQSMKRRDAARTGVLRMIKAALQYREIDKKAPLSEPETHQVLKTLLKQRNEAIEQYEAGGRPELADKERWEIEVIEAYLPEPVSSEEMAVVVSDVVRDSGAEGLKDMGKVMKESLGRLQATGKNVDAKSVSALVKQKLQALSKPSS
jgi:uncharacterized protein YqeY